MLVARSREAHRQGGGASPHGGPRDHTEHVECFDGLVLHAELDRTARLKEGSLMDTSETPRVKAVEAAMPPPLPAVGGLELHRPARR